VNYANFHNYEKIYDYFFFDFKNPEILFNTLYKYLGGIYNHIISKHITQFLVFYTPQGGTELSDRAFAVRY